MNLSEMLSVANIAGTLVSLFDSEGKKLIEFYAEGYEKLDPTILTKIVNSWTISMPHSTSEPLRITVVLNTGSVVPTTT